MSISILIAKRYINSLVGLSDDKIETLESLLECGFILPSSVFDGTNGATILELERIINRQLSKSIIPGKIYQV